MSKLQSTEDRGQDKTCLTGVEGGGYRIMMHNGHMVASNKNIVCIVCIVCIV